MIAAPLLRRRAVLAATPTTPQGPEISGPRARVGSGVGQERPGHGRWCPGGPALSTPVIKIPSLCPSCPNRLPEGIVRDNLILGLAGSVAARRFHPCLYENTSQPTQGGNAMGAG